MASLQKMLQGFSAVVMTGGSSGIGKSFLEHMGRMCPGLPVCNLSRRKPELKESKLKLRHIPCDLADAASLREGLAAALAFLNDEVPTGRILLINNSGFGAYGRFPEAETARLTELIDVNVRAVVQLTAEILPVVRQRGGAIMNVASVAGFQPTAYLSVYGASKAFVLHWSLGLAEELRGSGVDVVTLCPGPTSTAFFQTAGMERGGPGMDAMQTADEVALAGLEAVGKGGGLVVTGWRNRLMSLAAGCLPRSWSARIAAWVLARQRLSQI